MTDILFFYFLGGMEWNDTLQIYYVLEKNNNNKIKRHSLLKPHRCCLTSSKCSPCHTVGTSRWLLLSQGHTPLCCTTIQHMAQVRQQAILQFKLKKKKKIARKGISSSNNIPPSACVLSSEPINETTESHDGGKSEHNRVETQPGEVDAYLFPVVLPVEDRAFQRIV